MVHAWIMVADKSQATLFRATKPVAALEEINHFEHPDSRKKTSELMSDGRGRMPDPQGQHRSAMAAPTDPQAHEAVIFARRLIEFLEQGRTQQAYERLYVIAPPEFLGTLRQLYSPPLATMVQGEIDKNLVQQRPNKVRRQLPEYL